MTVIMGYKTKEKLFLGADNRASTVDDVFIRDNANKIVVVNDNVAVAFAGYNGTQILFEKLINKSKGNTDYRVEDALWHLKFIYWFSRFLWYKTFAKNVLHLGSRFIVAGKNRKDEYCLYTMSILHGKLEKPSLTERFMFPPSDVSAKTCLDIYAKKVMGSQHNFIQRTVKDIARISRLVSSSGDIWIYDMKTDKSTLEHFS